MFCQTVVKASKQRSQSFVFNFSTQLSANNILSSGHKTLQTQTICLFLFFYAIVCCEFIFFTITPNGRLCAFAGLRRSICPQGQMLLRKPAYQMYSNASNSA